MQIFSRPWIMLDGELHRADSAKASFFSQSLHYGVAVFDGIRAYKTSEGPHLFQAEAHFSRLKYSAELMGLALPYSIDEMIEMAYTVILENRLVDAYVRPLVFGGNEMSLHPAPNSHLMVAAWRWNAYYGHNQQIRLRTSSYQRPNREAFHLEAKISGHYVNATMATAEAKRFGFDDSLQLDQDGFVSEATATNIFFEKDGVLHTPSRGSIFPGITRQVVMELAKEMGIEVKEGQYTLEEVKTADSSFVTGTAAEVVGVTTIDDYEMPVAWEDSLGYLLARRYRQYVTRPNLERTII